jgi:hypothetical protein
MPGQDGGPPCSGSVQQFGEADLVVEVIWGWVKTLYPGEHENSWDLWMLMKLKLLFIGIDP